jgi:competence protein ComEA
MSRLRRAWQACVTWRWSPVLARCMLGALGLTLLAGIGRSALAGGALSPASPPVSASRPEDRVTTAPPPVASAPTPLAAMPEDAGAVAAEAGAPSSQPSQQPAPVAPSRRATPDDPVILNQAAFEDLRRLPGVGPKRAQAILTLRQRLGRFRQVEDLLKVKGVGRSTLRKWRPLVRLDPA